MAGNIYGVSQINEITPNLYLTSVYGATKENISRRGITLLVNAAQELPKQEISGVESIKLFLDDSTSVSISQYFDRIADKINEHASQGGRSLVHCVLGVSRSTTLCLAYLMKYKNMSLKSAFDYVSARRPCVRPNSGFWRQLVEYEKSLGVGAQAAGSSYATKSDVYGLSSSSSSGYGSSLTNRYSSSYDVPISLTSSSSRRNTSRTSRLSNLYGNYSSLSSSNDYNTTYNDLDYDYDSNRSTGYSSSYLRSSNDDYDSYGYGSGGSSSSSRSRTYRELNNRTPFSSGNYLDSSSYGSSFYPSSSSRHRTSLLANDDFDSFAPSYSYSSGRVSPVSTSYRSSYGLRY